LGYVISCAADPRSAAARSFTRFAKIQQHLVRLIRSYEEHLVVLLRRPDPGEFRPVKLDFFPPEKLCEIDRRGDRSKGESVRLGHTVDIVSRGYGSTTGHVLYDYVRLAWNLFGKMVGNHAGIEVTGRARRSPDNNSYLLSLIEVCLRFNFKSKEGANEEQ